MNKKIQFTVYIEQDEDGTFVGSVPSIPCCHAQGDTQAKMMENLAEVAKLCLRNTDKETIRKSHFIGIQNFELSHA